MSGLKQELKEGILKKPRKSDVFILLGSNLGDRFELLREAEVYLTDELGPIYQASGTYETSAWGKTDQPAFLNQVLWYRTSADPRQLLNSCLFIEERMGRERFEKWGARKIDIDLLYIGDELIQTEDLIIPHPHLHERRFTLVPLCEIAPDFTHPKLEKTNVQLLENCKDRLEVSKVELVAGKG